MVSLQRILIMFTALAACMTTTDAFPDPRNVGSYVFSTAKNLWRRESTPALTPHDGDQPLKLIDMIPSLADDRNIKLCQKGNLGRGPSKTWKNYHEICAYPFDRSTFSENITRELVIERLNSDTQRRRRPVPPPQKPMGQVTLEEQVALFPSSGEFSLRSLIGTRTYDFKEGISGNMTEWGSNPRIEALDPMDACQLCTSINDNYVVPRAYIRRDGGHQCVCKKWAKGDEKFMVCNCDLCDAFVISEGLRGICIEMLVSRSLRSMLTMYAALDNHNVFIVQYNDWKGLGKAMDFALQDIQKDLSVCKSGIQGDKSQDKHRLLHEVPLIGDWCPALLYHSLEKAEKKQRAEVEPKLAFSDQDLDFLNSTSPHQGT